MYFVHTSPQEHRSCIHTQKNMQPTKIRLQCAKSLQPTYADRYIRIEQINKKYIKNILSVMAHGEQVKSTRVNRDWSNAIKVTAPISI